MALFHLVAVGVHVQGAPRLALLERLEPVDLSFPGSFAPFSFTASGRGPRRAGASIEEVPEVEPLPCAVVPIEVVVDVGQPAGLRVEHADQLPVAVDVRTRYPVEGE